MDTPIGDEALNIGGGGVIFLKLPPTVISNSADKDSGAYVIQLSHYSGTCPKGSCKSQYCIK